MRSLDASYTGIFGCDFWGNWCLNEEWWISSVFIVEIVNAHILDFMKLFDHREVSEMEQEDPGTGIQAIYGTLAHGSSQKLYNRVEIWKGCWGWFRSKRLRDEGKLWANSELWGEISLRRLPKCTVYEYQLPPFPIPKWEKRQVPTLLLNNTKSSYKYTNPQATTIQS